MKASDGRVRRRQYKKWRQSPKILIQSVIIDGDNRYLQKRLYRGELIVPSYVLDELRHIADSQDPLKGTGKARARRLNMIQKELQFPMRIETAEVGSDSG